MSLFSDGHVLLAQVDKGRQPDLYNQISDWIAEVQSLEHEVFAQRAESGHMKEQLRQKGAAQNVKRLAKQTGNLLEMTARPKSFNDQY